MGPLGRLAEWLGWKKKEVEPLPFSGSAAVVHINETGGAERLMDMLAGWVDYIHEDGHECTEEYRDAVFDLYQHAGRVVLGADDPDSAAVPFFMANVLPMVFGGCGTTPHAPAEEETVN